MLNVHSSVTLGRIPMDVQNTIKDKGGTLVDFLYYSAIDTMVIYREDSTSRPQLSVQFIRSSAIHSILNLFMPDRKVTHLHNCTKEKDKCI